MPEAPKILNQFSSLIQIIRDLRGPGGCPWDQEQTHLTLTPYSIEETFEMVEAIESLNDAHICEELGDVLFQVVLHAQLADERKAFNIEDVIESINSKIVRRHPHVFSNVKVESTADVLKNWDEIKKLEKKDKAISTTALDIPLGLPALQRAHKIGEKTKKYKFDWQKTSEVLAQLKSEIIELEEAIKEKNESFIEHEMGDILFSAAQLARHLELEPETTLRKTNKRFSDRFDKMLVLAGGLENFIKAQSEQKEIYWQLVKKTEIK